MIPHRANGPFSAETEANFVVLLINALKEPGATAWIATAFLSTTALLLLADHRGHLMTAVISVTAVLLLSTGRGWRNHKVVAENIVLISALLVAGVSLTKGPGVVQIGLTPLAMVVVSLTTVAWSEWRFSPDFGQQGLFWAISESARATLWAGLGLIAAMFVCALLEVRAGIGVAITYALGAWAGRSFGLALVPARHSRRAKPPA